MAVPAGAHGGIVIAPCTRFCLIQKEIAFDSDDRARDSAGSDPHRRFARVPIQPRVGIFPERNAGIDRCRRCADSLVIAVG